MAKLSKPPCAPSRTSASERLRYTRFTPSHIAPSSPGFVRSSSRKSSARVSCGIHARFVEFYVRQAPDCPRIKPEFLAEEQAREGDKWFRQEYLCEVVVREGAGIS